MPRENYKVYTLEDAKQVLAEWGATLLSNEWKNTRTELTFMCSCGEAQGVITLHKMIRKTRPYCASCFKKNDRRGTGNQPNRTSLETIRAKFLEHGAILLATEYKNAHQRLAFQCACGNQHEITWSPVAGGRSIPRCKTCQDENRPRGAALPHYNPNLTDEHRKRTQLRPREMLGWYRAVRKAGNYECVISKALGKPRPNRIAAHHIYGYGHHPEWALDVRNGVCLGREYHELFHSKEWFGRTGDHTYEQFAQFYKFHTGLDWFGPDLQTLSE